MMTRPRLRPAVLRALPSPSSIACWRPRGLLLQPLCSEPRATLSPSAPGVIQMGWSLEQRGPWLRALKCQPDPKGRGARPSQRCPCVAQLGAAQAGFLELQTAPSNLEVGQVAATLPPCSAVWIEREERRLGHTACKRSAAAVGRRLWAALQSCTCHTPEPEHSAGGEAVEVAAPSCVAPSGS